MSAGPKHQQSQLMLKDTVRVIAVTYTGPDLLEQLDKDNWRN